MNNYVLFSVVGTTDPIRDGYDGPLLHIIRHYKPRKVYLFFSEEMFKKKEEIVSALEQFNIEQNIIKSDIVDAHNYDLYMIYFADILYEIQKENPKSEILINISSGTPQMTSTLAIEAITLDLKLKAIQVSSPIASSNKDVAHGGNILDNYDDLMENGAYITTNRCIEPDLLTFRKKIIDTDILTLINSFEYRAAFDKIKKSDYLYNENVINLIEYAMYKQNDDNKYLKMDWNNSFNFTKYVPANRIANYYCILQNKSTVGELSYFTLLTKPLTEEIAKEYLGNFSEEDAEKILKEYYKKENKEYLPLTYKDGTLEKTGYNLKQLIVLMYGMEKDPSIIKKFEVIDQEITNNNIRNKLAHQLYREKDINSKEILKVLKKLIIKVFDNELNLKSLQEYEQINNKIRKLIEGDITR